MSSSRSLLPLLLLSLLYLSLPGSSTACGPSCMAGYYYLERPNFNYSSNGCGSYGVTVSAPFGANPCCTTHDYCYSNCSTTKSNCDTSFDNCLTTQCATLNSSVDRDACSAQAELFFGAVMELGCPAYDSAQDQACECSLSANYSSGTGTYYLNGGMKLHCAMHAAVVVAVLVIGAIMLL